MRNEYPKQEEAIQRLIDSFGKEKQDLIKDYGIQDDLLDNIVEQAQEFSVSPSFVDAQMNNLLSQNLRNDVAARLASRSRYGGLEVPTGTKQAEDRARFAESAMSQRRAEQEGRRNSLLDALKSRATQRGNMLANKQNLTLNALGQERALTDDLKRLKLGKPNYFADLQERLINQRLQNEYNYDTLMNQDMEKTNVANRLADAAAQKRRAGIKGIGSLFSVIGGGLTGNPGLMKFGMGLGADAFSEGQSANVNLDYSDRKTPGYYGKADPKLSYPGYYREPSNPTKQKADYGQLFNMILDKFGKKQKTISSQ